MKASRSKSRSSLFGAAAQPCALTSDESYVFEMKSEKGSLKIRYKDPKSRAADLDGGSQLLKKLTISDEDLLKAWVSVANSLKKGKIGSSYQFTPRDICVIRDKVAQLEVDRGYFTYVKIERQSLARRDAKIELSVYPTRIANVRFHGFEGPQREKVEALLDHLVGLSPFDLETAERYLLLANDVPGVRVYAALAASHGGASGEAVQPGNDGDIDFDVTVEALKPAAVAVVQNTGSDTQGPWTAIGRIDLMGIPAIGDRTSIIGSATLGNNSQDVVQFIERGSVGSHGLFWEASFAYGHSHPGGALAPLNLTGDSYVGTVEVDDPLIRRSFGNVTAAVGLDIINQTTNFGAGGILSDDALRVAWVRLKGDVGHEIDFARLGRTVDGRINVTITARKGLDMLGASAPDIARLSRVGGRSDAYEVRADALGEMAFDKGELPPLKLSVHAQGQWADKPLLAYEQQAIGNYTIGRGYDPDAVTGDRAIAADFKLETAPYKVISGMTVTPYGFFDVARVISLEAAFLDTTLRSAGGGLKFKFGKCVVNERCATLDVGYAVPLDRLYVFSASRPPGRFLVELQLYP